MKKMIMCCSVIGPFFKITRVIFFPGHCLIHQYIICLLLLFQLKQLAQWLRRAGLERWDLGQNPRSPNICFTFFLMQSYAAFQQCPTMCFKQSACHVATIINPRVRMEAHHILQSTNRHLIQKVNVGLMFLGLRLLA